MIGIILVIIQFLLIISISILGLIQGQASIFRNIGMILGIAVGTMALYGMKFSMSVLPNPKNGQGLIESGIYKFIRHPAYLGVLISNTGTFSTHIEERCQKALGVPE